MPVYDGIGALDEPYRHVTQPVGSLVTATPTAVGPVLGGLRVEAGTPLAPFVAHLGADAVGWFVA